MIDDANGYRAALTAPYAIPALAEGEEPETNILQGLLREATNRCELSRAAVRHFCRDEIWRCVPSGGTLVQNEWAPCMIVSFRDAWLRDFFVKDVRPKRIPADLAARLFRKLQMLDDAVTDADLRVPPSNHFEKLRGPLANWHSIRVNEQWRLVFRWHGGRGEASDVYLDNHSYR